MKTTPFTYLLHCTATDQYYYGSRYGKGCHPSSLWNTYFTSSKVVEQLILEHGKDAFKVSVRKVFNTPQEARRWETKFLNRVKAAQSDKWINLHNADEKFYCRGHHGNLVKNIVKTLAKDKKVLNEIHYPKIEKGRFQNLVKDKPTH
jgi:hypothetical protein